MPDLINRLEKNYQIKVFVIRQPGDLQNNIYKGQEVRIRYGSNNNLKVLFDLFSYSLRHKHGIFHVYNIGPFFLLAIKLAGVKKIVYSIRGTIYWEEILQKYIRKFFWRIAISHRFRFIANSEYSRDKFMEKISDVQAIDVIYNPIFKSNYQVSNDHKKHYRIIYVGRLVKGKNLIKWIEIAERIHAKYPQYIFEIYGQGDLYKVLKERIEGANSEHFIFLRGFIKDVSQAYNNASALLFLSEYESFGNVAIESILCGVPVISSTIPSMKEIFYNYPQFLVELDEEMEKNVLSKVENLDQLRDLVPKAKEEFETRFSVHQHIVKLDAVYKSFIDGKQKKYYKC